MDNSHFRAIAINKGFKWEEVTPALNLLILCMIQVRRRFDYILRIIGFKNGTLMFQIRDARNSILPGSASAFVHEVNYVTSGAFQWSILDEGKDTETIGVSLKSPSDSTRQLSN